MSDYVNLEKGQYLFRKGEKGTEMYVIISGLVHIFLNRKDDRVALANLKEGQFIGEMSLLEKEPRSANAIALKPTKLLVIREDNFEEVVCKNPAIAMKIMKGLSYRVRITNEKISKLELEQKKDTEQ